MKTTDGVKKVTAMRLDNLYNRILNVENPERRCFLLQELIGSFVFDSIEEFDKVSHATEDAIILEENDTYPLKKKWKRVIDPLEIENAEQLILEVKDDKKRADYLHMLVIAYVDDDKEFLDDLNETVGLHILCHRKDAEK